MSEPRLALQRRTGPTSDRNNWTVTKPSLWHPVMVLPMYTNSVTVSPRAPTATSRWTVTTSLTTPSPSPAFPAPIAVRADVESSVPSTDTCRPATWPRVVYLCYSVRTQTNPVTGRSRVGRRSPNFVRCPAPECRRGSDRAFDAFPAVFLHLQPASVAFTWNCEMTTSCHL